jgi:hypothetical protein
LNKVQTEEGLFDIRRTPGERYNVKELHPEIVKKLEVFTDEARKELGDGKLKITGTDVSSAGEISSK